MEQTNKIVKTSKSIEIFNGILKTTNLETSNHLVNQLVNIFSGKTEEKIDEIMLISLSLMKGWKPKDTLETMLAVQMIGAYNLSMEFMQRASTRNQTTEMVDKNIDRANKLMRTFAAQMEALTRYRSKGQQKMIIKRVNVTSGGQAVIGNIGGGKDET